LMLTAPATERPDLLEETSVFKSTIVPEERIVLSVTR
jgi:hypothetical protein